MRHAEDRAASAGRFGNEGLSDRGRAQARELAKALTAHAFDACYSSPLLRAVETARILAEESGVELRLEPSLAEGELGSLDGLSLEEARRLHPDTFRLGESVVARLAASGFTAPGGETREEFLRRAGDALEFVQSLLGAAAGRALVMSHGGLLNYLLQLFVALEPRDEVPFGFDHCGVVRILSYREEPGFGPFPMLRFGLP